ncbi:hypothetical protein E2320_012892 [Naja naja]|nr:hypothetical protein E2320_012892 [Naja naja]
MVGHVVPRPAGAWPATVAGTASPERFCSRQLQSAPRSPARAVHRGLLSWHLPLPSFFPFPRRGFASSTRGARIMEKIKARLKAEFEALESEERHLKSTSRRWISCCKKRWPMWRN